MFRNRAGFWAVVFGMIGAAFVTATAPAADAAATQVKPVTIRVLAAQVVEQKYLLLSCELTNQSGQDYFTAETYEKKVRESTAETTVEEGGISLKKQTVSEEILVTPLWSGALTRQSGMRRIFQSLQVEFLKPGRLELPAKESRPLDLKIQLQNPLTPYFLADVTSMTVTCSKLFLSTAPQEPADVLGVQIALSGDQLRQLLKP